MNFQGMRLENAHLTNPLFNTNSLNLMSQLLVFSWHLPALSVSLICDLGCLFDIKRSIGCLNVT